MPRAYKALPPASELWERFDYKPLTGELVRRQPGKPVAVYCCRGYKKVKVNNSSYAYHRLIWSWVTGEDPGQNPVDHKDQNKLNNCFFNLRLSTDSINNLNRNTLNYYFYERRNRWVAYVTIDGIKKAKYYKTENEAAAMARQWKSLYS